MEHRIALVYDSFAKMRVEIEKMPEQTEQQKTRKQKALTVWDILKGLCFNNNPLSGLRQLDHEDQTGVYHKP